MTAMSSVLASGEGVNRLPGDELAQLIIEANRSFESDRYRAKYCLQRAEELLRDKSVGGAKDIGPLAVPGGLAIWQKKKLSSYIDSNIADRILAVELASLIRVSTGHFFRAFKMSFGVSPHAYILHQRILRAEVRIAASNEPLTRIALDCGLSDQAHLSRAFRRVFGVSPNIWRRSLVPRPDVEIVLGPAP